jgi:hypothetical protein
MARLVALRALVAGALVAGALVAGACGSETDDRPATLAYITDAILAPSCASAECHSAFRAQVGDVFDTVEAARRTIAGNGLVRYPLDVVDPSQSLLIRTLTVGAPSILDPSSGNVRMPYDAPLPDADIDLIRAWIAAGAQGAQCEPNPQQRGCQQRLVATPASTRLEYAVVGCVEGNVVAVLEVCPPDEVCDVHRENGRCVSP